MKSFNLWILLNILSFVDEEDDMNLPGETETKVDISPEGTVKVNIYILFCIGYCSQVLPRKAAIFLN